MPWWLLLLPALVRADPVPPPLATPVEMVVSGRTSTLKSIAVADLGQVIPPTYSGSRPHNCDGFRWVVSRHYALQTDYDATRAKQILTWLELAYPHYRAWYGRDLPDADRLRLATVYGKSKDSLVKCMNAWGLGGFQAGGITVNGTNATFNWPSGTLQYHQRYIELHESVHQFQMILHGQSCNGPLWLIEGMADYVSQHVWDAERGQLTLEVVDHLPLPNFWDEALRHAAAEHWTVGEILAGAVKGREAGVLLTAWLVSDPRHKARFAVLLDELLGWDDAYATANFERVLHELYGPPDTVEAEFATWLSHCRASAHWVDWGFEQDGDAAMSYGWPQKGRYSQLDLDFPPGEAPQADPMVLDFPRPTPRPAMVGAAGRGGPEPTVGLTVSFRAAAGQGEAGLGLGVEDRSHLRVLLIGGKQLLLDGSDLGAGVQTVDLPAELRAAAAAHQQTFGLTLTVAAAELRVTVAAETDGAPVTVAAALPLTEAQRQRLLTRPVALLSRDARHYFTPFLDPPPAETVDLSLPAPPNRWRRATLGDLTAVTRAAWRLGAAAPPALETLAQGLASGAVDHAGFVAARARLAQVLPEPAVTALYGLALTCRLGDDGQPLVALNQTVDQTAAGHLTITAEALGQAATALRTETPLTLPGPGTRYLPAPIIPAAWRGVRTSGIAELTVDGRPLKLAAETSQTPPIESWLVLGPFDGGAAVDTRLAPEEAPAPELDRTFSGKGGQPLRWRRVDRPAGEPRGTPWILDLLAACGGAEQAAAYAFCWLDAPAPTNAVLRLGSDDGVVVWLNGVRRHTVLVNRGCVAYSDRVPLPLAAGRNALLIKVTQADGKWALTARLDGAPDVAVGTR
jgi:hypothetical protein